MLTGFLVYLNVIVLAVFEWVIIFVKITEPPMADGDETPVVGAT